MGAVEKSKILTGQNVQAGDVVLGLVSHGVHSNGFSLVRKCIERAAGNLPAAGWPALQASHRMAPTRLYVKNVLAALANTRIRKMPPRPAASRRWPTLPAVACWRTFRACCPMAWLHT